MIAQTDIQKDTQTNKQGAFYIRPTLPRDNNLNKLEYTFSCETSTKVTAFLARWFFLVKYFNGFLYIFLCTNLALHCGSILPNGIII